MFSPDGNWLKGSSPKKLSSSELHTYINNGTIQSFDWQQNSATGKLTDGTDFTADVPELSTQAGANLSTELVSHNISWDHKNPPISTEIISMLSIFLVPIIIIAAIYFLMFRAGQAGGNQALNFGRSKAKRAGEQSIKITFADVAGIEEAKEELSEIVDFLKNTKKYAALGAKIPKGVLLTGPPGVGKTHLARAISGEAGVPFFHISGSDFVEMFVGVGAARVRDLFETAKAHRPSLIFIDEIDAVGRQRGAGLGGGHDEREQTLNQMLVEMDGFDPNFGVIMVAATNRPDVLDPALLRPGRFDRQIVVDPPDAKGRLAILKIHAKGKPLDSHVDLDVVARGTPGFTGADLANTLNEAALLTARRNLNKIGPSEIDEALDRVMAGPQRKSRIMDDEERKVIAYHEAGHAILGEVLEHADPVHKVTILPRGRALGYTQQLPEKDKFLESEEELLDEIVVCLGGRVAEETVFGKIYTGATSDLQRVTRVARAMVTEFGMSDRIGALSVGHRHGNPFLGRDYSDGQDYSEEVAKIIDEEIRKIVDGCHQRAIQILTEKRSQLDAVVDALLERETLTRSEFLTILEGGKLDPLLLPPKLNENTDAGSSAEDATRSPHQPQSRLEPGPA